MDSKLSTFDSKREYTLLTEDSCYKKSKELNNERKLKYFTTSFNALKEQKEDGTLMGMRMKKTQNATGDNLDEYSEFIGKQERAQPSRCGGCRDITETREPYFNASYKGAQEQKERNFADETKLRDGDFETKKKACLPLDTEAYNRSFTIFVPEEGIETPNALDSVETPENGFALGRKGIPSRYFDIE